MLTWLAKRFEKGRAELQARLEDSLRAKVANSETPATANYLDQGNEFLKAGLLAEAEACYRKGILTDARDSGCYSNLGYVLIEQGRLDEAERMLGHAITYHPEDADAHYLLGNLARDRHEWSGAAKCYETALSINAEFADCQRELCIVLARIGRTREVHQLLGRGLAFDANTAQYHHFKGGLYFSTNEFDQAIDCFQTANQLFPRHPEILLSLCNAHIKRYDIISALDAGRQVLELEPQNANAYHLIGLAYGLSGQHELAIQNQRIALTLAPQDLKVREGLLIAQTQFLSYSPAEYLLEAQGCAEIMRANAQPYSHWLSCYRADDARALRVGFVIGDLNDALMGDVLDSILPFLDPRAITCLAYASIRTEASIAARLKPRFNEWTWVAWMQDRELAARIHADRIDILVDVSGLNKQNRLSVFAWRPAPVQIAWHDFVASTGLSEVDYILVDDATVRAEEAKFFSETLWFLPDLRLCVQSPVEARPVTGGLTPALRNGYVTFASFQPLDKITDGVLKVWSQILSNLPSARLRLQCSMLSNAECVVIMQQRLQNAGFDIGRVDLHVDANPDVLLSAVADVDIVLDTFTFPGGVSTIRALAMGVPTVRLSGSSFMARQAESLMCHVNLGDWVAADERMYVELAVEKASDLRRLQAVRDNLRNSASASPLFDITTFCKNLIDSFRIMAGKHFAG